MRRPLVIYDFATAPFLISLNMRKIWFSFFISECSKDKNSNIVYVISFFKLYLIQTALYGVILLSISDCKSYCFLSFFPGKATDFFFFQFSVFFSQGPVTFFCVLILASRYSNVSACAFTFVPLLYIFSSLLYKTGIKTNLRDRRTMKRIT